MLIGLLSRYIVQREYIYNQMTKIKLIERILNESKIHHNIRISFSKLPDNLENWEQVAGDAINMFMADIEDDKRNDSGNRNLCDCRTKRPTNVLSSGICKEHDLWHFYNHGRMGATLYWDKYWTSTNSGFYFKHDADELAEMPMSELRAILKDVEWYNDRIENELMPSFYAMCIEEANKQQAETIAKETSEKAEKELERIKAYQQEQYGQTWYMSRDWHGLDLFEIMLCATNNYGQWYEREQLKNKILTAFDYTYISNGIHVEKHSKKTLKELKRKLESILPLLLDKEAESFLE